MGEFSMECDELTHGPLADGETRTEVVHDGLVKISRLGTFTFYQFHTTNDYNCRIVAQSRTEIRLVFVSTGQDIHVGCDGQTQAFSAGESNCSLVKEGCTQHITIHGGTCEFILVVVGLADISLPIADNQPHLQHFLNADHCAWLLDGRNMVLGIRKMAVIQQIRNERKPAYLQRAYTQLKLAELFVLFLETADKFGKTGVLAQLRPEELDRIRKVRDLLYDQPAKSYSLVGLARAVGTNEASLKKNFKAVYGTTVFGYLTARRMELAKALLLAKELKVAAVAHEVGYKYASHFSTAFRKHFGVLPHKLLRMVVPAFPVLGELETICAFLFAA